MTTPTEQNILKGCGKPEINSKTGNVMINCGDTLDEKFDYQEGVTYFHNYLCSECKSKLKGYQLAQKEKGLIKKEDVLKIIDLCIGYNQFNSIGEQARMIEVKELKAELEKL